MYTASDGLGIRSLKVFRKATLSKCIWKFVNENDIRWKKVRETKYGSSWRVWPTGWLNFPHGVWLQKEKASESLG